MTHYSSQSPQKGKQEESIFCGKMKAHSLVTLTAPPVFTLLVTWWRFNPLMHKEHCTEQIQGQDPSSMRAWE